MSTKHPKPNAFDDDEDLTPAPAPAPVAKPATPAKAAEPGVKRGRGRPPGPTKEVKPFPLRMHPDDHRLVKQLAGRDEIQMNELIYDALQLYCKTRAVHLKHAPGKVRK